MFVQHIIYELTSHMLEPAKILEKYFDPININQNVRFL